VKPSSSFLLLLLLLVATIRHQSAFAPSFRRQLSSFAHLFQAANDDDNASDEDGNKNDNDILNQLKSRAEEIQVEKARTKLEDENTKSFLKRRPLKLPYEDARRWVQGNLGVKTREEFEDLVENGNLRTPYIPKRPEDYYSRRKEWISWDHFLKGCFDGQNPSSVKPQSGIFD
jgi:hypothetical protein